MFTKRIKREMGKKEHLVAKAEAQGHKMLTNSKRSGEARQARAMERENPEPARVQSQAFHLLL
jgi:hypothetical protein